METDHLNADEKRAMVQQAIKNLAQQRFTVELDMAINQGNGSADVQVFKAKRAALKRGIANLEREYADLLAMAAEATE